MLYKVNVSVVKSLLTRNWQFLFHIHSLVILDLDSLRADALLQYGQKGLVIGTM